MIPAPLAVRVLPYVARYASRWLGTRSATSRTLSLGRFSPRIGYPASVSWGTQGFTRGRWNWSRSSVPLYGSRSLAIPAATVAVPAERLFHWENPAELPGYLPSIKFQQARLAQRGRLELPVPPWVLSLAIAPPRSAHALGRRGPPPEEYRRRKDSKLDIGWNRLLYLVNRTYGSADELRELWAAFAMNAHSPFATATALALNEAVDVSMGIRARALRQHIYSNPSYWQIPVGGDTLWTLSQRLFR